jgi:hypothetical protein
MMLGKKLKLMNSFSPATTDLHDKEREREREREIGGPNGSHIAVIFPIIQLYLVVSGVVKGPIWSFSYKEMLS